MAANVLFVIIPGQKKMVAAAARGEAPDPEHGIRGKQRSVHNTYFTLPVLFVMTSNHFAMLYGHEFNWLILIGVSLAGTLVRMYFVARHQGSASPLPVVLAALILLGIALAISPVSGGNESRETSLQQVRSVIEARCTSCHSATPSHPAFPAPPLGIVFDTEAQILADAERIYQQTVVTRVMPINNLTGMTEEERQILAAWYRDLEDPQ